MRFISSIIFFISIMEPAGASSGPTEKEKEYAKRVESILKIKDSISGINCTPASISTSAYPKIPSEIIEIDDNRSKLKVHVFSNWPTAERYSPEGPNIDG